MLAATMTVLPPTLPDWAEWPAKGPTMGNCRSCQAVVWWATTKAHGRWNPLDDQADPSVGPTVSHFATCPNAARHRQAG